MAYEDPDKGGGGDGGSGSPGMDLAALRSLYTSFFQQHPGLDKWGSIDDALNGYQAYRAQGMDDNAAREGVINGLTGWYADNAARVAPAPTTTTGGTGGSGGGGGGNTLPNPFGSTFTAPSPVNLGGPAGIPYVPATPTFTPPTYEKPPAFQYQPFTAPNASDVLADPSYNFRLSQGLGAISNSEAARGLWASGQTGKAFNDYAQNVASTEYGKVYDRGLNSYMTNFNNALNTYATNAQSQYNQPYQYAYQSAKDQFAPQILGYQTQAAAGQRQSEFDYTNAYNKWLADFDQKYKTGQFLQDTASR